VLFYALDDNERKRFLGKAPEMRTASDVLRWMQAWLGY